MIRQFYVCFCLALLTAATPLRAANRPHAGTASQKIKVWTNDDLEKLHDLGLISIVGQADKDSLVSKPAPKDNEITQDPKWYGEQAARRATNLNADRRSFVNTGRRLTTREVSGHRPVA